MPRTNNMLIANRSRSTANDTDLRGLIERVQVIEDRRERKKKRKGK